MNDIVSTLPRALRTVAGAAENSAERMAEHAALAEILRMAADAIHHLRSGGSPEQINLASTVALLDAIYTTGPDFDWSMEVRALFALVACAAREIRSHMPSSETEAKTEADKAEAPAHPAAEE